MFQIFQCALGEGASTSGNFCLRGGTPLHAMCAQHMQLGASAVVQLLCRLRVPLEGRRFFSVGIVKIEICEADVNAGDSEGDSPLAHARALAGHWQKKGVCWKTHVMSISQYNTIYDIYVACSDLPTDIVGCM